MKQIYRRLVSGWFGAVVAVAMVGCFSPKFDDGAITCGPNGECPPDLKCGADLLCHSANAPIKIDAPLKDAPPDVNTDQPDPPTLTLVTTSPSSNNSPTIQGTTAAGTTVDIFVGTCTGTPLLPGVSMAGLAAGVILPALPSDTTSMIRGQAKNLTGTRSVCSASITYVEDSTPPPQPTVTDTLPSSPSRSLMPTVRGTAENGSTVLLYGDAACSTASLGTMVADAATGAWSIQVTVAVGSSTSFYATARDAAQNTSNCSGSAINYLQDSSAVAPPVFTGTTPPSPSNTSTTPTISGTTEAGVQVKLYTDAACTSTSVGTATADGVGAFSIGVTVTANTSTTFYGQSKDLVSGTLSSCSPIGINYVHDTIAPATATFTGSTPGSPSNSTTPLINGTVEALAKVDLYTASDCSGSMAGTGMASAAGAFAVAVSVGADTTYYAIATDGAGNASACSSSSFLYHYDATPPAAPVIQATLPASPSTTSFSPTVVGMSENLSTVRIYRTPDCTGTEAANGASNGSFGIMVVVPSNSVTQISATATDPAGNVSACSAPVTYIHDNIPPDPPTITMAAPGSPSNSSTPTISGTSEAGATVKLYTNNTCTAAIGSPVTADGAGAFSLMITVTNNTTTSLYAKATDIATNVSACSSAFTYVEDSIAPATPVLNAIAASATNTTPTLTGNAEANTTVDLFANGTCTGSPAATGAATGAGTFAIGVTVTANTTTTFTAKSTDGAGNVSGCSAAIAYTHDNIAPLAPSALTSTPVSPAGSNTPSISGNAESSTTVRLFTNNTCSTSVAGTIVATGAGTFAVPITVANGSTTTFYANTTDAAGNFSPCSASFVTYTEDATPPLVPTGLATTPPSPASVTTPSVTGTTEANATVKLYTNAACTVGTAFSGVASGTGSFSIPVTVAANSSTTFYATATDAANNVSACSSSSVTYVEDAIAPAAPTIVSTNPVSPSSNNGPTVSGTAEASSTVKIYTSATCASGLLGTVAADGAGAFSVGIVVSSNTTTTLYATATDAASNVSACSSGLAYVEDSSPPATPNNLATNPVSPNNVNPSIIGNAEAGSTVSVFTTSGCTGSPAGSGVAAGGAFAIPVSVAANSTTLFYARATDAAGNQSSCSSSVSYTEDSTAPALPILTTTAPVSPSGNAMPTVNGTAEASATVKIYSNAACTTLLASGSATAGGAFAIPTAVTANATTTLHATATDAANNVSGCSTTTIVYTNDSVAPGLPGSLAIAPTSPANNNNPTLSGTAEAGSTVTVYKNATCTTAAGVTTVATGGGTFSVIVPVVDNTATTFYATATDAAGNVSACSTSNAPYTEDSAAPALPTSLATTPAGPSSSNVPAVTGTAEAGSTVRIYSDAACTTLVATGTAAAFGGAGITATVASDSSTTFHATATDAAGNVSGCSASTTTYVEDSTPPANPVITSSVPGSPGNSNTPSIHGTAEASSTVKIFTGASCTTQVGSGVAGGGAFAITVSAIGADGPVTYYANATDAAGNVSGCSAVYNYTKDTVAPTVSGLTTSPASPANNNNPNIDGTAEAGATVVAYTNAACTTSAGSVVAGAGGAFAIPVTVVDNTTTTYYLKATDAALNSSVCGAGGPQIVYQEDSTSVGVPVLVSTAPVSPSNASTTPTITGTAPVGATVKIYTNVTCTSAVAASVVADAAGNFTTPAITVGANSSTTFYATAFLNPNTSACSAGIAYVNDTVAPALPTGLAAAPSGPANNNTPTISGSAEASSTVKLYTNASCTSAVAGSGPATGGAFAIVVGGGIIPDNTTKTFYATATDAAGNTSGCSASNVTYVEDSAAPALPTLTSTNPISPSSSSTSPTITGTAEALSTVKIYPTSDCSGAAAGTGAATGAGAFTIGVTVAANSTTTFHATATDGAGNVSGCSVSSIIYVHDNQAPALPTGLAMNPTGPANNNTPAVTGSAEANATVTLYTNATCTSGSAGTGAANGAGAFSVTVGAGVIANDSSTTFYAKATDAAGNVSGCSTSNAVYVEDSTPPAAPTVNSTTPASPSKSVTTPSINGNAEAGATVNLYSGAVACSGPIIASGPSAGGAFTIAVTVTANTSTTFWAKAVDAAGNVSACSAASLTYVHDNIAPTTPSSLALNPTGPANNNAPSITGSAEAGATVGVYTDASCATLSTTGVSAGGAFSIVLSVADNTSTTFYTKATDAAGNVSGCSTGVTYVEDSSAPAVPVVNSTSPVSPSKSTTTPSVIGTAEANATVSIYSNSSCTSASLGSAAATAGGAFTVPVTVTANSTTTFYAKAVDAANNASGCSTTFVTYTHDNIAPVAPSNLATSPGSPSNQTMASVSGSGEFASTINVYFTNNCTGTIKATTSVIAGGSFSTAALTFSSNVTTPITALSTDAAGNVSACSSVFNFTEDSVAPATPTITSSAPTGPANNNNPTINGTAEAGATVTLYAAAACSSSIATGVAAGGTFAIPISVSDNTSTTVYARATDPAGNAGACMTTPYTYVEDSTPPSVPTIASTNPTSPGSSTTPSVHGATSESGATIKFYSNATCTSATLGSGVSGAGGAFTIGVTVAANATTTIYATAADPAGNVSACMASGFQYIEDQIAPAAPTGLAMSPPPPANNNNPRVTGSAENGATVTAYSSCGGSQLASSSSNGSFTINLPMVADNSLTTYVLTATDAAGNVSACSASIQYQEDSFAGPPTFSSTSPVSPSATSTTTSISGNGEANSTVTLYTDNACSGAPVASGNTNGATAFTISVTVSANSTTTFYGTVTDQANNVSVCSPTSISYTHDNISPLFNGPTLVTATGISTMTVQWVSATDAGSPPMHYDVCAATTPGGCGASFVTWASTAPGATSINLTGMATSQHYWIRARAIDGAGNVGTSPTEVDARTFGPAATVQVSAGRNFTCALEADGTVWCWGAGTNGELGNGSNNDSLTPVQVTGLVDVAAISSNGWNGSNSGHTCAVKTNGDVWCWGSGNNGELGNNMTNNSNVPVQVSSISKATSVSAGGVHTCATISNGTVKCWGYGGTGNLGNGSNGNSSVPVIVSSITTATAVGAGIFHTCALLADGTVECWGEGANGKLGNNSLSSSFFPVAVSIGATRARALSVGAYHSCIITQAGGAQCWGANVNGQIGNNSTTDATTPQAVADGGGSLLSVSTISAGGNYTGGMGNYGTTCAGLANGTMRCWGRAAHGQVGTGNTTENHNGTAASSTVSGAANQAQVSVGAEHSCYLLAGGTIKCFGLNGNGELGNNSQSDSSSQVSVGNLYAVEGATSVDGGANTTCARLSNGQVKCWGENGVGQLGINDNVTAQIPYPLNPVLFGGSPIGNAVKLSLGGYYYNNTGHGCLIRGSGAVVCWGSNTDGQLGNNSTSPAYAGVSVSSISSAIAIATGGFHSCAVLSNGTVQCWGRNSSGQLGDGTGTQSLVPVTVSGISNAIDVVATWLGACALLADGTVKCWGSGTYGQMGNNTFTSNNLSPIAVMNVSNAKKIVAAWYTPCAILGDGSMKCWGRGDLGTLGNSTYTTNQSLPVTVTNSAPTDFVTAGAGGNVMCATKGGNGILWCWGENGNGQAGVNNFTNQFSPVSTGVGTTVNLGGGDSHICAVHTDGNAECAGFGDSGQLGDGLLTSHNAKVPAAVIYLP